MALDNLFRCWFIALTVIVQMTTAGAIQIVQANGAFGFLFVGSILFIFSVISFLFGGFFVCSLFVFLLAIIVAAVAVVTGLAIVLGFGKEFIDNLGSNLGIGFCSQCRSRRFLFQPQPQTSIFFIVATIHVSGTATSSHDHNSHGKDQQAQGKSRHFGYVLSIDWNFKSGKDDGLRKENDRYSFQSLSVTAAMSQRIGVPKLIFGC
mmetsp:Transcript_30581/g.63866  ORF Transcript_30581/g.63866 Transcript_30581/m.63866 type:complete len:206 (+) Transcript_30581:722-1339(+)